MSEQLIATPGTFGENGNFLLERELGVGGMGGVYMGRDKMLDRPVAVKVMLKEYGADPEFVERFKKEAQSAAKLIHPNIAQIYSYGICDGMPYIAMELASGGSLYSVMTAGHGKTDIQRVLKICQQTAQALQCASDQGFVHGDVKPENILLDANGNAKLVDFGLAAMQKDTDEIWGTPYYISPEKVKKEPVDFRADMYSLGGTLYHALTGVAPFEGEDSIAVVKKRFEGAPRKPSEIRPEISSQVDALVMKMLELDREKRFPSFEALIEAFKSVLTTGLTAAADEAPAKAQPAARTAGGNRMTSLRSRRTMTMRRPGMKTTIRKTPDGEGVPEGTGDEDRRPKDEEDEESGGNLGVKIVLFVVGGILAIGAIIGGLVWYTYADKKAREEERLSMIRTNIEKARTAILDTRKTTEKFDTEFSEFAAKATAECAAVEAELKKLLPDWADKMRPAPTKELLDAIASTNEVAEAAAPDPAPTNAPAAAVSAPTNTPAATNAAPAKAAADTKAKDGAKAKEEVKDEKPAEPEAPPPQAVLDLHDLWARAYGCQASQIRIAAGARKLFAACEEASKIPSETEEDMRKLGEASVAIKDLYDQLSTSKDVENVRTGISYIKSKGKNLIGQTERRVRADRLEAANKARREAREEAEKAAKEKAEAERKALVEQEVGEAQAKFDALVEQGCVRQLDWKSAMRQLEQVKVDFKTSEGQLAVDLQLRKIECMKKMQQVFVSHMKNYVFKGKLRSAKVVQVNEKEMSLVRPDKKTARILWQKFFKEYPGNLNELVNHFIVNGRRTAGLNLKDWTDAMTGAALAMRLICAEVNGATERATALAQEAVKQFPEFAPTAKQIFPDLTFADSEE